MPQHYTQEEKAAIAKFFSSGRRVITIPPVCPMLSGAIDREEIERTLNIGAPVVSGQSWNSRKDGDHGESDAKSRNDARKQARDIEIEGLMGFNARRAAQTKAKYKEIYALYIEGVPQKEIMRRVNACKETVRSAIKWGKDIGQ